jgi:hypothetical protein
MRFSKLINWKNNNVDLRNKILETVIKAEKNFLFVDNEFCVMPNDLAHLISDMFNYDIDVLFDIACKILREKKEKRYHFLITILSNLIIDLFKNDLLIQPYSILLVLVIIEESVSNKINVISEKYRNLSQFIENIKLNDYDLIKTYIERNDVLFSKKLKYYLNQLIQRFNSNFENIKFDVDCLSSYILSFRLSRKFFRGGYFCEN